MARRMFVTSSPFLHRRAFLTTHGIEGFDYLIEISASGVYTKAHARSCECLSMVWLLAVTLSNQ